MTCFGTSGYGKWVACDEVHIYSLVWIQVTFAMITKSKVQVGTRLRSEYDVNKYNNK